MHRVSTKEVHALSAALLIITLLALNTHPVAAQPTGTSSKLDEDFVNHLNAGVALANSGKQDAAIEEFKKAALIKPDDQLLLLDMGQSYQVAGKNIEALEKYKRYLTLYPKGPHVSLITNNFRTMQTQIMNSGGRTSQGQDNYLVEVSGANGARWTENQMPIPVYVARGKAEMKGYHDDFPQLFKDAFAQWCDASRGKVSVKYVDSPDKARLTCSWTANLKDLANPMEGGQALTMKGPGNTIMGANILLLTQSPNVPKSAESPSNYMSHVCLHEIGHALGLIGHSSQPQDIMFSMMNFDGSAPQLTERDKKTMSLLYSNGSSATLPANAPPQEPAQNQKTPEAQPTSDKMN